MTVHILSIFDRFAVCVVKLVQISECKTCARSLSTLVPMFRALRFSASSLVKGFGQGHSGMILCRVAVSRTQGRECTGVGV